MPEQRVLSVHIGEIKIAKRGELLKSIFGSCVGLGLIFKDKNICGLTHSLLPLAPEKFSQDVRYVNVAIPRLIAMMKIKPEDFIEIDAVVVGGGNMTQQKSNNSQKHIGKQNFEIACEIVKKFGFRSVHYFDGKNGGLKIYVNANDFSFRVEEIPRLAAG
jgi:chemotaxis protein CheD